MIDIRPLWARALAKRAGTKMPAARGRLQVLSGTDSLTGTQFLDLVRALVGLRPLYAATRSDWIKRPCGPYLRLEALRRVADPDCKRCGGSGYYDAECLDMRCKCTGMKQRDTRPGRPRVDPSFALGRSRP